MEIRIGDVVKTRKKHPCGGDSWRVFRVGADIKIRCLTCGRIVMLERAEYEKRVKKLLEQGPEPEAKEGYLPEYLDDLEDNR